MFKLEFNGKPMGKCSAFKVETSPPVATAPMLVQTEPVEMQCAFEWSHAGMVWLDLSTTINFNECDKQAIANPWYGMRRRGSR